MDEVHPGRAGPPRNVHIPDREEFVALGLLDPDAADADDREALLKFLLTRGATIDDLHRSRDVGLLVGGSVDHAIRPGPRLTRRDVGWRTGLDDDVLVRLRQASGLPEPGVDAPHYTEADVLAARAFERLALLFGEAVAMQLMRVTGSALATIAGAAVGAYMINVAAPLRAVAGRPTDDIALVGSSDDLATARAFNEVIAALPDLARAVDTQLRHHIEAAIHQFAATHRGTNGSNVVTAAVGFMELVGSTSWARVQEPTELSVAVEHFATLANEVVTHRGGRLVKVVGDEAMFVVADPTDACEIALSAIEACAAHGDLPPLRVGLAFGEVVTRDGDYHGAVVNLASRIVNDADPSRVVFAGAIARSAVGANDKHVFRSRGTRYLRGFDEPIELLDVGRRLAIRETA